MLKRVRAKFIIVTMVIVVVLLSTMFTAILLSVYFRNELQAYAALSLTVKNRHLTAPNPDQPPTGAVDDFRSFSVVVSDKTETVNYLKNKDISAAEKLAYLKEKHASVNYYDRFYTSEDQVLSYALNALSRADKRGKTSEIRYITVDTDDGGVIVAGMDRALETGMFGNLTLAMVLIGLGSIGLLLVVVCLFSGWVVRPAKEAFDKQKQFIADAGHEIKTPVTVISASCDLLESELSAESLNTEKAIKWVTNIKNQTAALADMATDLQNLSKIDDKADKHYTDFDLSDAISTAAAAFDSVVYETGKSLNDRITPDIIYYGDADAVKNAVTILLDNAVKHSGENADIIIELTQGSRPTVSVFNTKATLSAEEADRIFERFYRSPTARANTAGSGLGLSILRALAQKHKWKIVVKTEPKNTVTFTILL